MKFIEITGRTLTELASKDELHLEDLHAAGVYDDTVVRVNEQGDIEVRRPAGWDVIGGFLGDFKDRIRRKTGMDWADPE